MKTLEFKQSSHLNPALTEPSSRILSVEKLLGRWKNTNLESRGLSEIVIAFDGARFLVSPIGVGLEGPIPWPTAEAVALANLEEEAGQRAAALAATFDFDFMTADTHLRVNKGVLVMVLFISFRDQSGRSDYVNREFYHRADDGDD